MPGTSGQTHFGRIYSRVVRIFFRSDRARHSVLPLLRNFMTRIVCAKQME